MLPGTVADVACLDAYAAREVLNHPAVAALSPGRIDVLCGVIATAGLGVGTLPAADHQALSKSVTLGEAELRRLLQGDKATAGSPPKEVPPPT